MIKSILLKNLFHCLITGKQSILARVFTPKLITRFGNKHRPTNETKINFLPLNVNQSVLNSKT